ncbi:hypothetical protein GCM10009716_39370 [Streptomyces sodiiphilus]|uniref:Helicase HerA-like C-terminal domain-containing protein n=1 Tax=Streptomyces sodiiphilus TaxID=226217 RepID=A0ABP5B073_9ACTN
MLSGFEFHQLTGIPYQPPELMAPSPLSTELFAAWTAAHAELSGLGGAADPSGLGNAAVATLWMRTPDRQQIDVFAGGRPYFPAAVPGTDRKADEGGRILFPPGVTSTPAGAPDLSAFPFWIRCGGHPDSLWTPSPRESTPQRRGGFDGFASQLAHPFAWLVLARPCQTAEVDRELRLLESLMPRLRQRANAEIDQVRLERAESRYRELARRRSSGMWQVHILVGAATPAAARRSAALLCAAGELDDLPYALTPGTRAGDIDSTWRDQSPSAAELEAPATPFVASTDLLCAVARPPRRELPGVRQIERADFDLTPECTGDMMLGAVLDEADRAAGDLRIPAASLNRHTLVAGATGSGKSQTVRHILESLHDAGTPWLVIEPAKAEYGAIAGRLAGRGEVTVIRPGSPDDVPLGINPLEPEQGFPLQAHIDLMRALFLASFEASDPFPQVLSQSLVQCYEELGWDLALSTRRGLPRAPRYPDLGDVQRAALQVIDAVGYGKEVADNVRGFVKVRLGSLRLGTTGRFFEAKTPLDIAELLKRNVVLEIEDIGNDQDKAFFIGAVLIRLYEHLRVHRTAPAGAEQGLRHVTVVEEAHRLLKNALPGSPAAHAVELFGSLLAEVRAYGEGILVAEQIPSKLLPDVIKNTAVKIVHRLPAGDDRTAVGATMNLNAPQSRHLVSLPPGRAAVFVDGMDRPVRVSIPLGQDRESTTEATRLLPGAPNPHSVLSHFDNGIPYTLRELSKGTKRAADPRLVLWIELLTIAHLTGRRSPRPDPQWLSTLLALNNRRLLDCAVATLIDQAIAERYSGLSTHYPPEDLAAHLSDQVQHSLNGGLHSCDGRETRWQAGQYRWVDIIARLKRAQATGRHAQGPHPDTDAWAARGLDLPGSTLDKQIAAWRNHPDNWRPTNTVVLGHSAAWRSACAALSNAPDTRARLIAAVQHLDAPWWPLAPFITAAEGGNP